MAFRGTLDIIDFRFPGIGDCTLYPLHSLPKSLWTYAASRKVAEELDLENIEALTSSTLRQQLMELPRLQAFPLQFIIVIPEKHLSIPSGERNGRIRPCMTLMKVRGQPSGTKTIFSYTIEENPVDRTLTRYDVPLWCLFKQKHLSQLLLPYKQ